MIRHTLDLAWLEIKLYVREPIAMFFSFVFPLLLLAFVGSVYGSEEFGDGIRFIDSYFPVMVGVTAANLGIMGLSIHLAESRSRGVLRRIRLSPLSPPQYFAAQMLTTVVVLILSLAGLALFTLIFYGPSAALRPVPFVAASVLVMYVMFSFGILIGGLPFPVRSVQVLGTVIFFFMFFSSGAAIQRADFPKWLLNVSEINPLTHLNQFLIFSYTGAGSPNWMALTAVFMVALGVNYISRYTFDWEGRS